MKKILILLTALFMISCSGTPKEQNEKPVLSVSILPQQYFVQQIAGDMFQVNVMIPPGASPATYDPSPAQLAALTKTDLYLMMGYTGFEMSWTEKLQSTNPGMHMVNLSQGIDLIMEKSLHDHNSNQVPDQTPSHGDGHHHGGIDPHTWLSPRNVKIICENLQKALTETYPEHEETFRTNFNAFAVRLDSLDRAISNELEHVKPVSFFTYHPSLSYYARDYGLTQIPLELMGKTPSASYLRELVDTGKEKKIDIVFLQMQFDQHNAEVLAREIGAEIVQINPLDPEWFQQILFITEKLTEKK